MEKQGFWRNRYLVQPPIILQDQAITANTSISGVMPKDPTWQDGQRGDMCPMCVTHHLGSHRVRHNNSSKMIIKPSSLPHKARRHSTAGTDRAGTAASFGAVPPQMARVTSAARSATNDALRSTSETQLTKLLTCYPSDGRE
jgi:hypothetical protein